MLCLISNDLLTYIKSFLTRDIFILRSVSRRFLVKEQNSNLIEVTLGQYMIAGVIPRNRHLRFYVNYDLLDVHINDSDIEILAGMSKKYRNLWSISANYMPCVNVSPFEDLPSYLEGGIHTLEMIETDIDYLPNISTIHTIDLKRSCMYGIEEFKSLGYKNGGTHTIKFEESYFEDLSPFANLHTVVLEGCNVDSVSALVYVQHIDLSWSSISDVSYFAGCDYRRGNTHTLILNGTNVLRTKTIDIMTNILALGGLHTIDLRDSCDEENEQTLQAIRDGSILGGVHIIQLDDMTINRCDCDN